MVVSRLACCFFAVTVQFGLGFVAWADDLPPATQKMLTELKLDPALLKGIDEELKVPDAWIAGAKSEGAVIIYDTIRGRDWNKVQSVFAARYPFVKLDHQEVHTTTRRYIMPMTALKQGRITVDLIQPLSGLPTQFRNTEYFENLSVLPNYKHMPAYLLTKDDITVATRLSYWCMSYNTKLVKPSDLPKTWDDLLDSKVFTDKKLMIANRPNNWVLGLWETYGDAWGEAYFAKFFDKMQPQIRKESLNALVKLTGIGEGHGAIPQAMNRVSEVAATGAPVGYHCPEPVTFMPSEGGILKNSPRVNGAKIFLNWFISREGQIAQFWVDQSTPVRDELHGREFLGYPDAVTGKKMVKAGSEETKVKVQKYWNNLWLKGGGTIDAGAEAE